MKWRLPSVRAGLVLYGGILVVYAALVGWWVYFFSRQHDMVVQQVQASGVALSAGQIHAIHDVTAGHVRMFVYEGSFMGVLLLVSFLLVVRAVRQDSLLLRQQRNFLSAVTHELNTPLAAARLSVETLLRGRVDVDKREHYLRSTMKELDRLRYMVDDVLATGRLAAKRAVLDIDQVDLSELVRRRVARYSDGPGVHGARVQVIAPAAVVTGVDVAAIEKVVDNLIANAIKYGGPSPVVEVWVKDGADNISIDVRDYGPGLQGADPIRILEPFVRGQDQVIRALPGAGLGLYIVSEFVKAHDGAFTIQNAPTGGGALARVRLPAQLRRRVTASIPVEAL